MIAIDLNEATDLQLNWLVAKVEGFDLVLYEERRIKQLHRRDEAQPRVYTPVTDPSQMWPIIHKSLISVNSHLGEPTSTWVASRGRVHARGCNGLVAAAKCHILASGTPLEVPESLA